MVKLLSLTLALSITWCVDGAPLRSTAAAQPAAVPSDGSREQQARRLFEEGLSLAQSERWAEALLAFQRSAELVPRASTSYNIANALYRLNRPADAWVELDRHAAMPEVQSDDAALEREAALRVLIYEAVAEVRLTVTPSDAKVFIDGRGSSLEGSERLLRLNPGTHSIRVTHESYTTSLRELQLERGSRESYAVTLELAAPPASESMKVVPAGDELAGAARDDRKPFVKRPGFWVMIGAIVVVGVGTGVAVALTRKDDTPQCGTTGSCATTQGLTVTSF
jgi:hypothetical protein